MNTHLFQATASIVCVLSCLAPVAEAATVAYWRFERGTGTTITDSSGNGNTGRLLNGPLFSTNVPTNPIPQTGVANKFSLLFDGNNDAGVIPDSPSLRPSGAITVEAWIRPTSGARIIVGKQIGSGCCANSYQLELSDFRFILSDAFGNEYPIGPGFEPSPNTWHHIAGTWDGSTMRLYLDGLLVATRAFAGPIGYDANPVLIANDDDGFGIPGHAFFRGNIDEIRISNLALSPSQFLSYNPPVGGSVTGVNQRTVTCQNLTTGQSVSLGNRASWNCEAGGLRVNPGDRIRQTVTGTAF